VVSFKSGGGGGGGGGGGEGGGVGGGGGGDRLGNVCIWGRKRVRNGESQLCAHDKSGFWRSKHPPKV